MFVIYLKLTEKKSKAPDYMAAHNAWIASGVVEGAFLVVGSLKPQGGGAILAHGEDRAAIEARIEADPFVREGIVVAEIQEVAPVRTDNRLAFLLDAAGKEGA